MRWHIVARATLQVEMAHSLRVPIAAGALEAQLCPRLPVLQQRSRRRVRAVGSLGDDLSRLGKLEKLVDEQQRQLSKQAEEISDLKGRLGMLHVNR